MESAVGFGIGAEICQGFWEKGWDLSGISRKDLESVRDFGTGAGSAPGFRERGWDLLGILGKGLEVPLDFRRGAGICLGSVRKGLEIWECWEVGNTGNLRYSGKVSNPKIPDPNRGCC